MCKDTILDHSIREQMRTTLDEIVQQGAQKMLAAALEAEVSAYLKTHQQEQDDKGHALVVRNGYAKPRTIYSGAGEIAVKTPRVNDKRQGKQFGSCILPPYMRKTPRLDEAIPVLYLRGLSTGDFSEALGALLGKEAVQGFSASTVTRLLSVWQDEYKLWKKRPLTEQYAYIWADGVHFNIRLEEDRLACLVIIGVRADGSKELLGIEDGYRESSASWATLLRSLKQRGMKAPKLAIGDGALGFWKAVRDVYPETQEQRCWVHKIANVLDKLPKRVQPRAKAHLHEIMRAEKRADAVQELGRFEREYGEKFPKAWACLNDGHAHLLTFFDFPASHWIHLRTTNVIESAFATVKARTKKTKGAGSRRAGLAMAFKLMERAETRWRKVNSPHLVPLVLLGVEFPDGKTSVLPALELNSTEITEPSEIASHA